MFAKERAGHFMSLQVCKRDENVSVRVIHAVREEDRGLLWKDVGTGELHVSDKGEEVMRELEGYHGNQ